MRNLIQLRSSYFNTGVENCCHLTKDDISGTVFMCNKHSISGYNSINKQVEYFISLTDHGYLQDKNDYIISLHFLFDQECLCFATTNGDLFTWHPDMNNLECVGSVDAGFTNAEWSPDQELLVLTTGNDTFVLMTREFDPICEYPIHSLEFGQAEPVNVGWGKKETQFHGSEGKEAAQVKKPQTATPVLSHDKRKTKISWRGDGQFFTISSVNKETDCRFIRIFDSSGLLQATNETIDGLEDSLSWRPSGNLIVTSQRKPNKHDVIFLEKNGLQHGEFTLPYGSSEKFIVDMKWNSSSDVLCIVLQDQVKPTDFLVELWTVNNYHWYLKQELSVKSKDPDTAPCIFWDSEDSLKIHILQQDGGYISQSFKYDIVESRGTDNLSMVAVIDGFRLLLTPFKKMIVPPPMSAYSIQMPRPINMAAFGPNSHQHDILALLSNKDWYISHYEKEGYGKPVQVSANGMDEQCLLRHMKWRTEKQVCVVADYSEGNKILLLDLVMTGDEVKLTLSATIEVKETIHILFVSDDSQKALMFEDTSGHIYSINQQDPTVPVVIESDHHLTQACNYVACRQIDSENMVFGLTGHHRLLMNQKELASNCTSFVLHEDFLLLTTHSHTLRSVYLSSIQNIQSLDQPNSSCVVDEAVRRVERGSKLVTATHQDTAVILQMPRGNLETIHPRALVITYLQKLLTGLEYFKAFDIMKRNRINLNLFYDHNPTLLLENVDKFIVDIKSVNHINLFLADLSDEDVTTSLYFPFYHHGERNIESNKRKASSTKVNTVCEAVRNAIEKNGDPRYLLALLTSYAKQSEPDLETVLVKVKQLKDNPPCNPGDVTYEMALKHVFYLVDVNQLFDIALGLYDFDIVLMVAQKSQKDPKEYLPFLNNFKNMEATYLRFSVDKYLKRYPKALNHIAKCPDRFEECLAFVKEHRLHRQALKLFPVLSKEYKSVSLQYGEYLMSQKLYEDAGFILSRSEHHKEALTAFLKTTNWNMMLTEAKLLKYGEDETIKLCREISENLKENRLYDDAATILEVYVKDVEESVACLLQGGLWFRALNLILKSNRPDLVETNLTMTMMEHYNMVMEKLEDLETKYKQHRARLQVVLEKKERERIEILEGLRDDVENDLYSDTSSITGQSMASSKASSKGTKMTGNSRKSRAKQGRKKYSLREGSKHEDFALREAMCEIIRQTDEMKEEVSSLLKILMFYFHDDKCTKLQQIFGDFLVYLEASLPDVWKDDTADANNTTGLEYGPDATVESILAQRNAANVNKNNGMLFQGLPEKGTFRNFGANVL